MKRIVITVLLILAGTLVCAAIAETLLNDIDLSDQAVSKMSKGELWQIGVENLNWPAQFDDNLSKGVIHQRLLDAKYVNVGDFDKYIGLIEIPSMKKEICE